MTCGTGARQPPSESAAPNSPAPWFLLPATWCVWLLVWLVPSLLLAPHLETLRAWLTCESAPTAVIAAAAFFLAAIWPFWPALAVGAEGAARRFVLSVAELAALIALASPFALVAWSVGGRTFEAGPLAAAVAAAALFALGLRMVAGRTGQGGRRWLMLAAMLVCAGPLAVAYAAGETLGPGYGWLAEVSPITAAVRLTLDGWPADSGYRLGCFAAWPAAGIVLIIIGLWRRRRPASGG